MLSSSVGQCIITTAKYSHWLWGGEDGSPHPGETLQVRARGVGWLGAV